MRTKLSDYNYSVCNTCFVTIPRRCLKTHAQYTAGPKFITTGGLRGVKRDVVLQIFQKFMNYILCLTFKILNMYNFFLNFKLYLMFEY